MNVIKYLIVYLVFINVILVNCNPVNTWVSKTLKNDYPGIIDGGSAVFVKPGWGYVFYGFNETIVSSGIGQSTNIFYDTVYVIQANAAQTLKLDITGVKPPPRAFSATSYNGDSNDPAIYLWGGSFYDYVASPPVIIFYNDLWRFNIETLQWTQVTAENAPSSRGLVAYTTVGNKLVLNGGVKFAPDFVSPATNYQDFLIYDPLLNKWLELEQTNDVPQARYNHNIHYWSNQNKIVLFGGAYANNAFNSIYFTDIYDYDLNTSQWTRHPTTLQDEYGYSSLKQPITFLVGDYLVIQGGDIGTGNPVLNEKTIIYNLLTKQFTTLNTNGPHLKRAFGFHEIKNNFGTIYVGGGYDWDNSTISQVRFDTLSSLTLSL
jgi:hypothetical protein